MNKYTTMYSIILIVFVILSVLFSLYVKKLLAPIKRMALALKGYSPNTKVEFPDILQNNEIGLISNALSDMQESILNYSLTLRTLHQLKFLKSDLIGTN
jgi:c-di-GMP phosphodiesterase